MAPTRKSRSVNKRFSQIDKVSPNRNGETANRNSPRQGPGSNFVAELEHHELGLASQGCSTLTKRKFSDMLGSQWSEEELTHFYEAYRKHGKDWKKVAAAVRNRTIDMVVALYTMNRAYLSLPEGTASVVGLIAMMTDYYSNLAYLSLPEGTASVVGLIAMMTDYYSNLEGSDSEQESNDGAGTSRKPQKRARGKVLPNASKANEGSVQSPLQNVASSYGCLSLLTKQCSGGSQPRVVGKRTPRFPVSYSHENNNGDKYFSPIRPGLKIKGNANDDEVAHEIAIALAEASHRVGSPQLSRTPNKKTESGMSPAYKFERKYSELETARSKRAGSDMDEDLEGSMEAHTGELSRYRTCKMASGKARKHSRKNLEVDESIEKQLNEIKEACSGTEESQRLGVGKGKFENEDTDAKISRSSSQIPRKRSKKVLFSKDEESVVDALQALANWPLRALGPEENGSVLPVKHEVDDRVDESGPQEATPRGQLRDRQKSSADKLKESMEIYGSEVASRKTLIQEKISVLDDRVEPEFEMESNQSTVKAIRKKPKAAPAKIRKNEAPVDINQSEFQEVEARDVGKKSISKIKRSSESASPTLAKNCEDSSSNDPRREGSDSAQSTVQVSVANEINLPTTVRGRRKMHLKKPEMRNHLKFREKPFGDQTGGPLSSFHNRASSLKMVSSCLSNYQARRWCVFEWFYSAIDYPWFAKREFVEYLNHVGLGHVPRLTRVEWGVIRSSLGKPRRFSEQFLKEEKEKLNQYRDSVRTHYTELREGIREGLPTDLAKPLSVGQCVIAIHPKTREIHDGNVLTVDRSRCRVQFVRPELGVEFVMDIDCMPLNAFENIPASLARHTFAVDKFFENLNELNLNWQVKDLVKCSPGDAMENVNDLPHLSPSAYRVSVKQIKVDGQVAAADGNKHARVGPTEAAAYQQTSYSQPNTLARFQVKEADVQALADLTRALDKKEAVVLELRCMNDDVIENQKDGNSSLKDSEPFKKQYAAVLVQLHEANEQVSSALYCLRQRNTYQGQIPLTWPRPNANFINSPGLMNNFDVSSSQPQESGSHVNEIIESSKTKARTMVDAAVQAMSTLKVNGNTVQKIAEAIDYVNDRLPLDDSCMPPAPDLKVNDVCEGKKAEIPSELITQCLATLLMIQKCTERQFPPADVAQILDSAVTGLQPCCSQNLPFYAEIQKCMGIIRNQILALVPTN